MPGRIWSLSENAQLALGCCAKQYGAPSLKVDSRLVNDGAPLTVGVHFPEFVHVINRTTLDALFECLDTTADLIKYLKTKEVLFNMQPINLAGEEDLLAAYMCCRRPDGTATHDSLQEAFGDDLSDLPAGAWGALRTDQDFLQRKTQLGPSYLIDDIIEDLASEYYAGRMLQGQEEELAYHAAAFHILASESRVARMLIGMAVIDVLHESPSTYWSAVVESADQPGVLFLWLIYPKVRDDVSNEELEYTVDCVLADYIFVAMGKFPKSHTVFGIALPNAKSDRTSRVFKMGVREIWTSELQEESELLGQKKGIMTSIESTIRTVTRAI